MEPTAMSKVTNIEQTRHNCTPTGALHMGTVLSYPGAVERSPQGERGKTCLHRHGGKWGPGQVPGHKMQ